MKLLAFICVVLLLFSCSNDNKEGSLSNDVRKESLTGEELSGIYEGSYGGSGYTEFIRITVNEKLEFSLELLINGEKSDFPTHSGHLKPYVEIIENKEPNGDVTGVKYNHFIEFVDNDGTTSIYRSNYVGTRLYPARSFYSSNVNLIKK